MRVEGFKWEKNTWPQTSCPQNDEEEKKTKENTKGYGYFLGLLNGAHGAPLRPHRPMRVRIIYYN